MQRKESANREAPQGLKDFNHLGFPCAFLRVRGDISPSPPIPVSPISLQWVIYSPLNGLPPGQSI
jgi:hypothetical protein